MPIKWRELRTSADELKRLETALRDLWEGGWSWRDAIEMILAPEELRPELRRKWNSWNRKHYG